MHTPSTRTQTLCGIALAILVGAALSPVSAEPSTPADRTVEQYRKADPGLAQFFHSSAGYAVFSTVGKGGAVFGGAYGKGVLYEAGKPVGRTSLTQATVGLQLGAQQYSEIIFFETAQALNDFKHNQLTLASQASAVALHSGASANARYRDGVAVFTATKQGLMFEGSIGGQRLGYTPFATPAAQHTRTAHDVR